MVIYPFRAGAGQERPVSPNSDPQGRRTDLRETILSIAMQRVVVAEVDDATSGAQSRDKF
jgi:hypothetical protein